MALETNDNPQKIEKRLPAKVTLLARKYLIRIFKLKK